MISFFTDVAEGILAGGPGADRDTAAKLVEASNGDDIYDLFYWANRIRLARLGSAVRLCAIAAGKVGMCSEDCAFCGQSAHHVAGGSCEAAILSHSQIIQAAEQANKMGAVAFGIVNSGRGPSEAELDKLAPTLKELAQRAKPCLCASLGILSDSQARRLHESGVERYNHNLETSRKFFPTIVTTHTYDDRLATIAAVKRAGMTLCCGGIFGLGETMDDRLDLAATLAQIEPDEVPMNFLHRLEGTPLSGAKPLKPLEILRMISVFRFVLPNAHIKVAGGREVCLRDMQSWIFFAGASGFVLGDYLLTKGRSAADDRQMLSDLELLTISEHTGLVHEVQA